MPSSSDLSWFSVLLRESSLSEMIIVFFSFNLLAGEITTFCNVKNSVLAWEELYLVKVSRCV